MASRRDRQKEQLWRGRVREQAHSGLSIREFCESRGVLESSFYFWRRELQARETEHAAAGCPPAFAAVTLASTDAPSADLELVLTSGVRVRVPVGFDPQTLRELLAMLELPAC